MRRHADDLDELVAKRGGTVLVIPAAGIPSRTIGVPSALIDPRGTRGDARAYDEQSRRLAGLFHENFRQFESEVSPAIASAGLPAVRGIPS